MTSIRLELRLAARPVHPARAWYVPGEDAGAWLREIAQWNVPHAAVKILPLPRSRHDRAPRGALIIPPAAELQGVSRRCLPFGLLAGRLYLPVEAILSPQVEEQELRDLLDPQYEYVWHPQSGLVALAAGDVRRASDLLTAEPEQARVWDSAKPGVAFARKLTLLGADMQLTIEQLMRQAGQGIGEAPPSLEELPPGEREPSQGFWSDARRAGRGAAARFVKWFTDRAPRGSDHPTWINSLEDWANRQLQQISENLEAARNRELLRLMDLLASDPDRGLRYALPLTGDAHRGTAPRGARLGPRNVDFNLSHLGGGQAADFWDVPGGYHWELHKRYRELADRETRLGRHRRAAYIFAELLGDFESAATTLKAGRHWREAAVLYRERLGRPLDAARCLEEGGLWSEAVELYDEQQEHEKSGDLLVRLELRDEARLRYERALENMRDADDHLSAARLLEEKLDEPHEALTELSRGWPDSGQAAACLRRVFQLAGKLGEHEESLRWVARLRGDLPPRPNHYQRLTTVEILTELARDYPDRSLRDAAAEGTRTIVSRELPQASGAEAQVLVSSLARLVPEDRLLERDGARYLEGRLQPKTPARPKPRGRVPRRVATLEFAPDVSWKSFAVSGKWVYAAGMRDHRRLVLGRCEWGGRYLESRTARWRLPPNVSGDVVLAVPPHDDSHVLLHAVGGPVLERRPAFTLEFLPSESSHAGGVVGMPLETTAASRCSADHTWLLHDFGGTLLLVCVTAAGQTVTSMPIDDGEAPAFPPCIHARTSRVYVGYGSTLLVYRSGHPLHVNELRGNVVSLSGTLPHTLGRVAVMLERGGVLFWESGSDLNQTTFGEDLLEQAVAGFNRRGLLIAACTGGGEVYSTGGGRLELLAALPRFERRPLAVLPAPHVKRFAIATEGGRVDVYEMP